MCKRKPFYFYDVKIRQTNYYPIGNPMRILHETKSALCCSRMAAEMRMTKGPWVNSGIADIELIVFTTLDLIKEIKPNNT